MSSAEAEQPYYVLVASPSPATRLKSFFGTGRNSPIDLLREPPSFREMGFDLRTLDAPHLVADDCYEVRNGDRKVLRLYQDGSAVFRAEISPDFLAWGQSDRSFEQKPLLNPVPVVECTTAFVHFIAKISDWFADPVKAVSFTLALRVGSLPAGVRVHMREYYKGGIENVHNPRGYPLQMTDPATTLQESLVDVRARPNEVAYRLLVALYGQFDAPEDIIPFVAKSAGVLAVSLEELRAL